MIPLRIGRARRVLIVAPHADDEAIGAFGLIRLARRSGAQVRILVVSDGAGSHRASARWPKRRLVAERRRETRRVMRGLGVPAGAILQLGLPDGGLTDLPAAQRARIGRAVRWAAPDLLVAPASDDAHPDHRAVSHALSGVRCPARRLAYRVWPDPGRDGGPLRHAIRLGAAGAAAKRAAIRRYRSQAGAITDDPAGFAISPRNLLRFAAPIEYFREERR